MPSQRQRVAASLDSLIAKGYLASCHEGPRLATDPSSNNEAHVETLVTLDATPADLMSIVDLT
jgi:hypothetical protein